MKPETTYTSGKELRRAVRSGQFVGQTAGQAPDYLQGNIVILPKEYAKDFLQYCLNNPKPCPLIGVSKPGDYRLPDLGDIDVRKDVPVYRVFRNGEFVEEVIEIESLWNQELVSFVLGCSFTFEEALQQNGFRVHHISKGTNVPMYRTNIQTMKAGIFSGPLVVTMRSFPKDQVSSVFEISARYSHAHGAPVYWGDPGCIGIKDLQNPDYGDPVEVPPGEVPVFWACGVTPQAALEKARPTISITHAPGCMLVTDLPSSSPPQIRISLSDFADEASICAGR